MTWCCMRTGQAVKVQLSPGEQWSSAALADLTDQLRVELLELPVANVDTDTEGPAPVDAKGIELAALGRLIVSFGPGGVLASVVSAVESFLKRDAGRTATLEIAGDRLILTGISGGQQQELIDSWIKRHEATGT